MDESTKKKISESLKGRSDHIWNKGKSYKDMGRVHHRPKGTCWGNNTLRNRTLQKKRNEEKRKQVLIEVLNGERTWKSCSDILKKQILYFGFLENKCNRCGIGPIWMGSFLSFQLHHKDGDGKNNRKENLCLLCPNCHSQTPTFAGKKKALNNNNNKTP